MSPAASRVAVYWTPEPDTPLWQAGCRWLGRDPGRDHAASAPPLLRASPWRYGFHATLKAPMTLRAEVGIEAFVEQVARLAAQTSAFDAPRLAVATLDDFIALRPVPELAQEHPLHRLAARCVQELDDCRTPTPRRRAQAGLDARQAELLARWDYPHVLDRWRFHLTLSDALALDAPAARALQDCAHEHFASALALPLSIASLCVFEEPAPGAALRIAARLPLRR